MVLTYKTSHTTDHAPTTETFFPWCLSHRALLAFLQPLWLLFRRLLLLCSPVKHWLQSPGLSQGPPMLLPPCSLPGHFTFHNLTSSLCSQCTHLSPVPLFSRTKAPHVPEASWMPPDVLSPPHPPCPKVTFVPSPRTLLASSSSHQAPNL